MLLKDTHGHASEHDLKVEDKLGFMGACERWEIHQTHADVVHLSLRGSPVAGLATEKGFACAIDPAGCTFACRSREWMGKHVKGRPQHNPLLSNCYRSNAKNSLKWNPATPFRQMCS
jgi:Orsellinic acid/F9775 biosynthesis cluster protein D